MLFRKKIFTLISLIALYIAHTLPVYAENEDTQAQEEPFSTGEEVELNQSNNESSISDNLNSNFTNDAGANNKQVQFKNCNVAKVIALNKITAKSKEISLKIGESQYFGNIEIKIHKCLKSLDQYFPNNNILLTVTEQKIDDDQMVLFQGWLMSSSISVSTFEHPVYEIFAKDCL